MKIDAFKPYGLYTQLPATAAHGTIPTTQETNGTALKQVKQDTVSISGKPSFQAELGRAVQDLTKEVYSGASPARLAQLKQQVESGDYQVSSKTLAQSMMGALYLG